LGERYKPPMRWISPGAERGKCFRLEKERKGGAVLQRGKRNLVGKYTGKDVGRNTEPR